MIERKEAGLRPNLGNNGSGIDRAPAQSFMVCFPGKESAYKSSSKRVSSSGRFDHARWKDRASVQIGTVETVGAIFPVGDDDGLGT